MILSNAAWQLRLVWILQYVNDSVNFEFADDSIRANDPSLLQMLKHMRVKEGQASFRRSSVRGLTMKTDRWGISTSARMAARFEAAHLL